MAAQKDKIDSFYPVCPERNFSTISAVTCQPIVNRPSMVLVPVGASKALENVTLLSIRCL
jgi:hypothetical protein